MNLTDAYNLAESLMRQHGLREEVPGKFWHFEFSSGKKVLGYCKYSRRTLYLSAPFAKLNGEELVRDVILHEIAHALAPRGAHHGPQWQLVAIRIGARPEACQTGPDMVRVPGKWQARCPGCGTLFHRYRLTKRGTACRACCRAHGGGFQERFRLTFQHVDKPNALSAE